MRIRWNSLAVHLALPLGFVTVLVVGMTVILTENFLTRTVERVFVSTEIDHMRDLIGREISGRMEMVIRDGLALAEYPDVREFLKSPGASRGQISGAVKEKLAYFKKFYGLDMVYAATAQSRHYYNESGLVEVVDLKEPESAWFLETLRVPFSYLVNVDSDITGELHLWIDAKVQAGDGDDAVGLAGGGIKIANVLEPIAAHLERYRARAFLIDPSGIIRADSSDLSLINRPYDEPGKLTQVVLNTLKKAQEGHLDQLRFYDEKGKVNFLLLQEIPVLKWTAVVTLPREAFTEPLEGVTQRVFYGGVVLLLFLLVGGGGIFLLMVGRPLNQVAQKLLHYDYGRPFEDTSCRQMGYEIGLICTAFEKNAKMLRKTLDDYRRSEEALRQLNTTLEVRVDEKTRALKESAQEMEAYVNTLEKTNDALQKAKEEALQAAQARSNFISSVSHELRTPLNAIINFTDQIQEDFDAILKDPELQDEAREFLGRVMNNSRHLLQLINDLLDFTKAEAGKMVYSLKPVAVAPVMSQAFENFRSLLTGSTIRYEKEVEAGLPEVRADARRLLQIILNFLSNAVKFTKEGHIILRAYRSGNRVVVEVEDTGRGIPKEKLESIFDPFSQVNAQDSGTGLGLGLVRHMCHQMQIHVELESEVGRGSVFRILIPLADENTMDK